MLNTKVNYIETLSILNTIPGCHLFLLPDAPRFTIVGATDAYLQSTYLVRENAIGQGVFETLTDNPYNHDATGVKNLTISLLHVLEHKRAHRMAYQRYDIYNHQTEQFELRVWSPANTPVLNANGAVAYIIHTVEDVTEQVRLQEAEQAAQQKTIESEARYRNLFEAIDQGFCLVELIYDDNGRPIDHLFLETNPAYEAQTGLKNVIGKTAREVAPGINGEWFEMYDRAVRTGKAVSFTQESKVLNRWFDVHAYPTGNKSSRSVAILLADVTERKKTEEMLIMNEAHLQNMVHERTAELMAKNKELERSNKELDNFTYAASHDLKEPIRKIHFFTDRLKTRLQSKLEDEDRRYFERLENGSSRMVTLIDDLLLYSHVNRGITLIETVDLNQMLSFVLDDLELHIEEKGAEIEVEVLPTIKGRPRQLQQMFENLIGNALKYSKEGIAPKIKITARLVYGKEMALQLGDIVTDKHFHLIEVKYNGIGFRQEDAERIFYVFTRLHGNGEYRGTGIGLSIVQKIAENHHGYIWAESIPGEGSTFKLLMPVE